MTTGKSVSEALIHLLSYCGLTDARMRASEKDLPGPNYQQSEQRFENCDFTHFSR